MSTGRLLRTVELPLGQSSASFTLREVPQSALVGPDCLEAGLVLSFPGLAPFSLWITFMAGRYVEEMSMVTFHLSGIGLSGSLELHVPWAPPAKRAGSDFDVMPEWAAANASNMGHDVYSSREAAAFLSGMVLEALSEAWAASLVRRACEMTSPGRVVELAREEAVRQVVEG